MQLFEWSTALLIAVFVAVLALSLSPIRQEYYIKIIASLLVAAPTLLFSGRVLSERRSMARQAEVVEKIQERLELFTTGVYLADSAVYPARWHGVFARNQLRRKTPYYYAATMNIMLFLVLGAIWLVL